MKSISSIIKLTLSLLLLSLGSTAFATRIIVVKGGPGDGGKYYNGNNTSFQPGDTLVLQASQSPYAYFGLENVHGSASNPIVIINEGGVVQIPNGIALTSCTYLKVTGSGSSDYYGIQSSYGSQVGMTISKRSAHIEVERTFFTNKTYGFWIKEEAHCDPQYQFPNWVMDDFKIHHNKVTNMGQSGMYLGSTAPNGERAITCNGATIYPKPLRLGNFKVHDNIIDHTSRAAIQLSGAQFGANEIYNNTISNVGFEFDPAQGNGIVLGGYTTAYVHHNTISNTYSSGIFSLGAGLIRIENNTISSSGSLAGQTTVGMSSIMIDTRLTQPTINTTFIIKNNVVGANTDKHVRVYNSFPTFNTDNVICSNMPPSGAYTAAIANGIIYTGVGCVGGINLPPTADAGLPQIITLPVSSAQLTGSGLDPDGNIVGFNWSKVAGPAHYSISSPNSFQSTFTNLEAGVYTFRLTVTDNGGLTAYDDVTITVLGTGSIPVPPAPSGVSIPGKIEAESYTAMSGVQKETTSDVGGGQNVGYIENSDWMDYNLNSPAADNYNFGFRVASHANGAKFEVRRPDGSVVTTVNVPNTGGWQTYQTVNVQIPLVSGAQSLRLISTGSGGWNINWIEVSNTATTPTPVPQPAPSPTVPTVTLPGKFEAEAYAAMLGVQKENTADAGGGENIGWIDNGDWMEYPVSVATAGAYTFTARASSGMNDAKFEVRRMDGTILATIPVANTGGWQNFQNFTGNINLTAGSYSIRVVSTHTSSFNLNWFEVAAVTTTPPAPQPTPPTPTGAAVPGKIEAESYTAMSGIQKENTADAGGGQNLGYIDQGDWMDYPISVATAGNYTVTARASSGMNDAKFEIRKLDGTVLSTINIGNTGGWQNWQNFTGNISLAAGTYTIRVISTSSSSWNINWIEFAVATTPTPVEPPVVVNPPVTTTIRVEAESYTSMSGVQKESTQDAGGGQNVGYIDNGDWMDFWINPSGTVSSISFRVASQQSGGSLQVRKQDGTVLASVSLPTTGGWQTWQTVTANISIAAGAQTIRIVSNATSSWNINWIELSATSTTTTPPTTPPTTSTPGAGFTILPAKIEAESWSNMSGVQVENTQDAGGGQNVGYIDNGDWMEYKVHAATAGNFTMSVRTAAAFNGAKILVKNAAGTTLATINLNQSGGWQSWQTQSVNISLPQGDQVLRLQSAGGSSGFNINWIEFSAAATTSMNGTETVTVDAIQVSPNPVVSTFMLKFTNAETGAFTAEVINGSNNSIKTYSLVKQAAGTSQFYLSASDIPSGNYTLKVTMNGSVHTTAFTKQ